LSKKKWQRAARFTTGRFSSFSANPWILKARPYGRVLVHIMMRLDVEGLANTFKLSEGAPEQLDGELIVIEERFLVGVLSRRLLPLLQLLPTAAFVVVVLPSSPLRRRWAPRRHLLLLSMTEDLLW
jgi:hypothetical protein